MRTLSAARPALFAIMLTTLAPVAAKPAWLGTGSSPEYRPASAKGQVGKQPSETQPSEFDLDAFIVGLNPPTVEEIIKSLEPIPTLEEALEMREHPAPEQPELSDADAERVVTLKEEIWELREKAEYAEAAERAVEILQIRRGAGQSESWWEVAEARRLADDLRRVGGLPEPARRALAEADRTDARIEELRNTAKHKERFQLRRQQLAVRLRWLQREHPDVALSLNNVAELLREKGEYASAEPLYREALALLGGALNYEHPHVATVLNNLALSLKSRGNCAAAEPLCRKALILKRELLGEEHSAVTLSLNTLASILEGRGELDEAERIYRSVLATRRDLLGDEHADVALSLNNLAGLLEARGDYAEAESLYHQALEMNKRLFLGDHSRVAAALGNLAGVLRARGDLAGAESLRREALAMKRRLFPGDHIDVAVGLNNLAGILQVRGERTQAEALYRETLALLRRLFDHDHPYVASSLNNLATILHRQGKHAEAEALHREALAMRKRLFPGDHQEVAANLCNLAPVLHAGGYWAEAESLAREALAMYQRLFPDGHPDVAWALNNVASILQARGDLASSESLFREALAIRRRFFPSDHPAVALSLNNLGGILKDRGDLMGAEPLFREALAMYERLFPGDHASVSTGLKNLAQLLWEQGELAEAETLAREALAMCRRVFPRNHRAVAKSLDCLALILADRGDLAGAEETYRGVVAIYQSLPSEDHRGVASSLSNLAHILRDRGDLAEAEDLLRQATAMCRRLYPSDHPVLAWSLNSLAGVLTASGEIDEAESLCREALAMYQQLHEGDHPKVAWSLNSLAGILADRGDLTGAEHLQRKALAMHRRLLPGDHPDVAIGLKNLARILRERGDLAGAEGYFLQALEMAERLRTRIIGAERERAAFAGQLRLNQIGTALAGVMLKRDRAADALGVLERSRSRALLDLLDRSGRDVIEEAERAAGAGAADELAAALAAEEKARIEVTTAEALLGGRRKERKVQESRDGLSADKKARRLAQYDQQIAELEDKVKELRHAESDAHARVLALVRKLYPDARPMSAAQVRAGLEPGELLLYYAWAADAVCVLVAGGADSGTQGGRDATASGFVQGCLLANGEEAVEELATRAANVRALLADRPSAHGLGELEVTSRDLFTRLVPDELRTQILAAKRVIVVPDGPLQLIPLEALASSNDATERRSDKGDWLLDARPEFVYAPSATVYLNRRWQRLARDREGGPAAGGVPSVVALGDPLFDRERPPKPKYPEQGIVITMVVDGSNAANAGLRRGDVVLSYDGRNVADYQELVAALGHVKEQVAAGQRSADERIAVTCWTGGETHETTLAPGWMGVRLDRARPAEALDYLAMRSRGEAEKVAGVSALDQIRLYGGTLTPLPGTRREASVIADLIQAAGGSVSELLCEDATIGRLERAVEGKQYVHLATHGLTGSRDRPYDASLALTQPVAATPDDIGFLTLDRIIRRWRGKLRDCDLVVLSACDTQRGVKAGDSMMALPWGFMYAGAPTVVASLWKVDDTATALLMIRLYENLLGSADSRTAAYGAERPATSKAAALRQAKLWLRELTDKQVRALCETYKLPRPRFMARGETGPMGASGQPGPRFKHPYYWASFILIGDPN